MWVAQSEMATNTTARTHNLSEAALQKVRTGYKNRHETKRQFTKPNGNKPHSNHFRLNL